MRRACCRAEFAPRLGPAFGDLASGTFLSGAAAALVRKERTGRGAVVDVSLLVAGLWMVSPGVVASQLYGIDDIPRSCHADLPNLVAAYTTPDNFLVYTSGIQTEGHFEEFCALIGRKDLLDDPARLTSMVPRPRSPAPRVTASTQRRSCSGSVARPPNPWRAPSA